MRLLCECGYGLILLSESMGMLPPEPREGPQDEPPLTPDERSRWDTLVRAL